MSAKQFFIAAVFVSYAVFCHELRAELAWEQKTIELNGDARSPILEAHFQFANTGSRTVQIQKVESSCGCTTTALAKSEYGPQEKGEIVAKYTVGTHLGLQKKTILVVANDGHAPVTLTIIAHIPEILRIAPPSVTWMHNAPLEAKHLALDLMQEAAFDQISVDSSNPDVVAELVPVTRGRKYDLVVKPAQTVKFALSKLTIHCRFGDQEKTFVAYATVQPGTGEP